MDHERPPWPHWVLTTVVVLLAACHASIAYAATYSGGAGTLGDPYLISTPQDLLDLSNPVNSADWDKHFLMTNDIDMSGVTGFTPIAPDDDPVAEDHQGVKFTGVFDGGGHAIWNLTINLPTQDYVGLFGYVDGSAGVDTGDRVLGRTLGPCGDDHGGDADFRTYCLAQFPSVDRGPFRG